jgi:hypothetical protein
MVTFNAPKCSGLLWFHKPDDVQNCEEHCLKSKKRNGCLIGLYLHVAKEKEQESE